MPVNDLMSYCLVNLVVNPEWHSSSHYLAICISHHGSRCIDYSTPIKKCKLLREKRQLQQIASKKRTLFGCIPEHRPEHRVSRTSRPRPKLLRSSILWTAMHDAARYDVDPFEYRMPDDVLPAESAISLRQPMS